MVWQMVTASLVVMLASLVGVVATWRVLGGWVSRNLHYLVSFSAGVFLVVALGLVREVSTEASGVAATTFIVLGALLFAALERLMPESHHHHDPSDDTHTHTRGSGVRILLADSLHNVADGIILVPAFLASTELGIAVALGIVVHEAVQEISEFFVLRGAGYSVRGALGWNFLVSATIFVGVAVSFTLSQVEGLEPLLLGLAAGGFLYIVFLDLVPHSLERCRSRHALLSHGFAAVLGIMLMFGLGAVLGDAHGETEANALVRLATGEKLSTVSVPPGVAQLVRAEDS